MNADIGICGLGVMGKNLALNLTDHGYTVAAYNRSVEKTLALAECGGGKILPCRTLEELVHAIRKPAPILMMIKAGDAVDGQIDRLMPLLAPGDILMDGGNSHYRDTQRRSRAAAAAGLGYLGVGISGGEEGARSGPSIMPGGDPTAYRRVEAMLAAIAAKADGDPCCAYIGPDASGHYVKMVHNGIEYADMQLIAEAYFILRHVAGLEYSAMRDVFSEWNEGELSSYLVEITADILGRVDPGTGMPMCEIILDRAGQKGTGAWSGESALALGVPAPTVAEAVFARSLSALKEQRVAASGLLAGPAAMIGDRPDLADAVRHALYGAKICCYAQGFALLAEAGKTYGWNLDLGEISSLWRGGCIIRAAFLSKIEEAYLREPALDNLLLDPYFAEATGKAQEGWRETLSLAVGRGVPVPAFASALSYYDGYRTGFLWANMIQAQRDYFGAHTYERVDRPGAFHTDWTDARGREGGA